MTSDNKPSEKKYKAFISYSHANNQGEGRKWADWLHHALETYEIPEDLIGKKNQFGQQVPRQIFPVFQDEKELSASSSLSDALTNALDGSEFLVYLSSPHSAKSRYVRNEIKHFKKIGRSKQIIALILSGEPEYGQQQTDKQCFPDELRYNIDENGNIINDQPEEVLAADARIPQTQDEGFTSAEAYRRYLHDKGISGMQLKSSVEEYKQRLDLALLKVIAGILGVQLNELTKRDQAYQLEKAKQKNRNIKRIAAAISGLAIVAIIAGIVAWNQKSSAMRNLARSLYASGINKLTESEYGDGAAYIAEATRQGDDNAALFAHSMLAVQSDLTLMPNVSGANARFSPNGKWIVAFANSGADINVLQIWNAVARKLYKQLDDVKTLRTNPPIFDASGRVYAIGENNHIFRYDIENHQLKVVRKNPDSSFLTIASVSPNGKYIAYRNNNNTLLLNTENKQEQILYRGNGINISDVFFNDQSTIAVLKSNLQAHDGIIIFNIFGSKVSIISQMQLRSGTSKPSFSKDGREVVFNNMDGVYYYNVASGQSWQAKQGKYNYRFAGFTDKNSLTAGNEYYFDQLDVHSGRVLTTKRLPENLYYMNHLAKAIINDNPFNAENSSPDLTQNIIINNSQTFIENIKSDALQLHQYYASSQQKTVLPGPTDKEFFILNKDSRFVDKINVQTGSRAKFASIPEKIVFIDLLAKPNLILIKDEKNRTYFFDGSTGKAVGKPFDSKVKSYLYNGDQSQVLARTGPNGFGIWDVRTGKQRILFEYGKPLAKFTASPDFKYILSANDDQWEVIDVATKKVAAHGKGAISSGAYNTTGEYLIIVSASGKAQLLETKNYKPVISIRSIEFPFIVFNNKGNVLAISEDASHMRLWNLDTKKSFGQTIRISKYSKYFHFSDDDSKIFVQDDAANLNSSAKIVDAHTGSILTMPFINKRIDAIFVMKGDQRLLTVEPLINGFSIDIWEVPGLIKIPSGQLADDLEKFYGKKYDPGTGAILNYKNTSGKFNTWYFDDPLTRTVSPSSTIRILDNIRANYPIKTEANLYLLATTYGYHPLARALVAHYFTLTPETQYLGGSMVKITEKQLIKIKDKVLKAEVENILKKAENNLNK